LLDFPELESVLIEGQPYVIDSQTHLPPGLQEIGLAPPLQGLIMPLGPQDNLVGALVVADRAEQLALVGKRRDIVTGIAYQVALAVDNARLYAERARQQQFQRELELAREIQSAFIPQQLPVLPGWEIATFWKMAREVGGDFFDLVVLPEDRLLVLIADVSDKGMPAALFMALSRSLFQATALELNQPAEILHRVNRLLLPNNQKSMFVTVFCAMVQLRTGEISYASAGHNDPILVRHSGQIELLHAPGIVLGAFEDVSFEQKTVRLAEEDGILFYTDGITEASNPDDELFGEARLQAIARDFWPQPPETIVAAIQQAILDFTRPAPQFDDATLLLLKRTCADPRDQTE
jgi:sigma-B regulation protein RsbU (phosphoserine phosphatase)